MPQIALLALAITVLPACKAAQRTDSTVQDLAYDRSATNIAIVIGDAGGDPYGSQLMPQANIGAEYVSRQMREFGFDVRTFNNDSAVNIFDSIREAASGVGQDGTLMLYFAGHSSPNHFHFRDSPKTFADIADLIKGSRQSALSRLIVIADTCYSGRFLEAALPDSDGLSLTNGPRSESLSEDEPNLPNGDNPLSVAAHATMVGLSDAFAAGTASRKLALSYDRALAEQVLVVVGSNANRFSNAIAGNNPPVMTTALLTGLQQISQLPDARQRTILQWMNYAYHNTLQQTQRLGIEQQSGFAAYPPNLVYDRPLDRIESLPSEAPANNCSERLSMLRAWRLDTAQNVCSTIDPACALRVAEFNRFIRSDELITACERREKFACIADLAVHRPFYEKGMSYREACANNADWSCVNAIAKANKGLLAPELGIACQSPNPDCVGQLASIKPSYQQGVSYRNACDAANTATKVACVLRTARTTEMSSADIGASCN